MGKRKALSPNLLQKKLISGAGLNCRDWLVLNETAEELQIVRRGDGASRTIKKPLKSGKTSQRSK